MTVAPIEEIAVHFHDTRGTALANVLVAVGMGVTTVDSAVGGLGGCPYAPGASGNLATEDVVYMLHGMGIETGIDLDALVACSSQLAAVVGHEMPSKYTKAALGARAKASSRARHRRVVRESSLLESRHGATYKGGCQCGRVQYRSVAGPRQGHRVQLLDVRQEGHAARASCPSTSSRCTRVKTR